ncbi:MAG: dioxygenase [Myxococcaceae bacterium]|nr:dioxygenase [Myxococcaceae bacterium]MCA3013924.1 dioxygenase [Myxococcaceae bacterium]
MSDDPKLTRRQAAVGVAGAVGAAVVSGLGAARASRPEASMTTSRMPTAFLPHGGGPWPFVDLQLGPKAQSDRLRAFLEGVPRRLPASPRALLVVSAHWEAPVPTVTSSPRPPMLYDYSGFPPESYAIEWPAPGDPALAQQVRRRLEAAGFTTAEDPRRGFDHGTFVPLKLAWPGAEVPTVQLSLVEGLDPATHLRLGRALAPLRDEGVFVVGSGMTFHDLRAFFRGGGEAVAEAFDAWLQHTMRLPQPERDARLTAWATAPFARRAHPREEHLLPLMVVAGAGGDDPVSVPFADRYVDLALSAYQLG